MGSTIELRNKCSSKTVGLSFGGIGKSEESTECSRFDAASNNWEKTSVNREERMSYGVLPTGGVDMFF